MVFDYRRFKKLENIKDRISYVFKNIFQFLGPMMPIWC